MKNPKNILITGASSGIGQALAAAYAGAGVTLYITGRNRKRLDRAAEALAAKGAKVVAKIVDVTDEKAMAQFIREADNKTPLDLVVANAGVGVQQGDFKTMHDAAKYILAINVGGVFNTVHPALPLMKRRGRGQIAIVSSLAGYVGLPGSPLYSATKNAVRAYGEALRGAFADQGIEVNVICPGWVRSRITERNKFEMPFFMEAAPAAEIIKRGLERNKGRIAFPWPMVALVKVLTILPASWAQVFLRRSAKMRGRA